MTSPPSLSFFEKKGKNVNAKGLNRKRAGVSPVISTTIIIAITVTLGLALWGFANSGVSAATQTYLDSVTRYGEFTTDTFVIANVDFDNPSDGSVAFWIFNSGKLSTSIGHVVLTCRDCGAALPSADLASSVVVSPSSLSKITFDVTPGQKINGDSNFGNRTYELTAISDTGATQHYLTRSN